MEDYFSEIINQSSAKQFIRTALHKGNLYNLLLVGPRGVGKRLFAFALARALGCPVHSANFILIAPIPSKLKGRGKGLEEYLKKYLPDNPLVELEERSSIHIEQIKRVIERFLHMPGSGTKRVVLILEADRMTDAAANSFLKTLEEPPIDTIFILTSSRVNFLLPTIRSRCQILPFSYLKPQDIEKIIYDGEDKYLLGSPGEILRLREKGLIEDIIDIFRSTPLLPRKSAHIARTFERKNILDLFYPLILLYRITLYKKLDLVKKVPFSKDIVDKAQRLSVKKIINTLVMLNQAINLLEQNPNRLLLLFDCLMALP